jgi:SAM-dependent methyltransferase
VTNLTDRSSHFEFGENWRDYAKGIGRDQIDSAKTGLQRLLPEGLAGKSFIDVGCGSGIHALCALDLGAASVTAVDIDENSVATTRDLLERFAAGKPWTVRQATVFELGGEYDVVYSWGVLHHTGAMWEAIKRASALLKPGGLFVIAIYAKTPFCRLWRLEKAAYSRSPSIIQMPLRVAYMATLLVGKLAQGLNPIAYLRGYSQKRGMSLSHDAHDWLGGYPYESASVDQMREFLSGLGLVEVRTFPVSPPLRGLLGSGCSEYVFRAP